MTTPTATANETKVITGEVRLSYVHLFEPSSMEGQDPRYSTVILIPKTDEETLAKIKRAQQVAARAAVDKGTIKLVNGKLPPGFRTPLRDGDTEADLERNPEFAGHYWMNVASKQRPGVVDQAVNKITDSTEVYSGCYARVSINAFAYNTAGNKGVSFGLNNVMKVRDGDYLGGRSRPEDDFSDYASSDGDSWTGESGSDLL